MTPCSECPHGGVSRADVVSRIPSGHMLDPLAMAMFQQIGLYVVVFVEGDEDLVSCSDVARMPSLPSLLSRLVSSHRLHRAPLSINYAGADTLKRFQVARTFGRKKSWPH